MIRTIFQDVAALMIEASLRSFIPGLTPASTACVEVLTGPGHRWRPSLFLAVWRGVAKNVEPLPIEVRRVLIALECFHKGSLIHDDIEDGDTSRNGLPTLHMREGMPSALNIGDLLIGHGYRLIAEAELPPLLAVDLLRLVSVAHCRLCEGQGRELHWRQDGHVPDLDQMCDMFVMKTSTPFDVAMRVGALLGGGSQDLQLSLSAVASPLGVSYQLLDDVADRDNVQTPHAVVQTFVERVHVAISKVPDPDVRCLIEELVPMMISTGD